MIKTEMPVEDDLGNKESDLKEYLNLINEC